MMKELEAEQEAKSTLHDILSMGDNKKNAYDAFCD
jgi:hypothetical protein